jgi:uncharacterized membrane protein YphA (DoxX/SURF4 family)
MTTFKDKCGLYWGRVEPFLLHRYFVLFSRIVLGGIFIFAGGAKIGNISTLINYEIPQYQLPFFFTKTADGILQPTDLATVFGYALPPLEILIGVMLIAGIFLKLSSVISGLISLSFIIANASAIARGLGFDPCPCFGAAVPLLKQYSLIIDCMMLALSVQIFFRREKFLELGSWIKGVIDRSKEKGS